MQEICSEKFIAIEIEKGVQSRWEERRENRYAMFICKIDERVATGYGVATGAVDVDDQWKPRWDVIFGILENVVDSTVLFWYVDCVGYSWVAAERFEGHFSYKVGGSEEFGGEVDGVNGWWRF